MDLSKLNLKQLEKLKSDLESELKKREKDKLAEARKAVEAAAKKHGFSLSDLVGGVAKSKKGKAAAKFKNPANASQTWSGRGRQPAWFKDAIAAGKTPEDLAV